MIVYPSKHIDEIIPSEVVIQILQHLEPRSRCRAARVSRRWNVIAYSDPGLWQRLDLSKRISWAESDETRNSLTRWATSTGNPVDERLRFLLANAAPRTPSTLTRFRRLQRLSLNFCPSVDLTVFEEPQLVGLLGECLTHLSLNGCGDGVDSFTLYHLRGLKGLCSLDVAHCEQIDDRGMEVIAHFMQQLSQLNLSYLFKLTDDGVRKLMRMPNLSSLDLTGCYRIKTYPWATSLAASTDSKRNPTLPLKELYLGEDSRLQTSRGFWLLWFSFSFNISTFVQCCPLLETLRLNMVLFDSVINDAGGGGGVNGVDNLAVAIVNAEAVAQPNVPQVSPQLRNALTLLVSHCKNLSHLSLIVDKSMVQSLCTKAVSARLSKLRALELTFHIGVTAEHLRQCVEFENGEALSRLTATQGGERVCEGARVYRNQCGGDILLGRVESLGDNGIEKK
ncbi:hypothetical protein BJ742DRAFT_779754 [Cladochytrium replicatum]|nr:hypothetical protein BJ742DRAFT_779754 [Cladochytrium replicatum]